MCYCPAYIRKVLLVLTQYKTHNTLNIQPKIVSGSEIFSHMLDDSEHKICDLFADARRHQKLHERKSTLHIIVFDKVDAVCKGRSGHVYDIPNNVEDSVITQLLTEIDGMFRLDNVFLIGITNDIDSEDPALFRSDRIDTTIKIGVPDDQERLQIFDI